MDRDDRTRRVHDLDVSVWVGKGGIDTVRDELDDQLSSTDVVKVKFLRAARGERDTESLAEELAEAVDGTILDVRGHTAVIER